MTPPPEPKGSRPPTAASTEALAARADLTRLHKDVVDAEERVVKTNAADLLEANQHLVVSTLRAQVDAETSAKELKESWRPNERDVLTGLPNRALMLERFAQAIDAAKRNSVSLAVLFLDLDGFKRINDTLGHATGDYALKLTANCLVSLVRSIDTVSRHGGDEFLILLSALTKPSDALLVAEKVIAALAIAGRTGEHSLGLTASIGISVYPHDGEDPETLIDRADAAMYLAKKHALGRYAFHGQQATPGGGLGSVPPCARSER